MGILCPKIAVFSSELRGLFSALLGILGYSFQLGYEPGRISYKDPQYITLRGPSEERSTFELSLTHVGGSYLFGSVVGVTGGLLGGFYRAKQSGYTGRLRFTQTLNSILKRGTAWAQVAGTLALLYSIAEVGLVMFRGYDDEITTMSAATISGSLFQAPGGVKRSMFGGLSGLCLSSSYCIWNRREKILEEISRLKKYSLESLLFEVSQDENLYDIQPTDLTEEFAPEIYSADELDF